MFKIRHQLIIGALLLILSAGLFFGHYLLFGQWSNTLYYSLMSLCFIPINILAVTLVFENLMTRREKQEKISKLNMLTSIYFSEIGFSLLDIIVTCDKDAHLLLKEYKNIKDAKEKIKRHKHCIDFDKIDFDSLESLLIEKGSMLTMLISNQNVLEHETFTDLLMATLHLRDEFVFRKRLHWMEQDYQHVRGDLFRIYQALMLQWLSYLEYLQIHFPYLYDSAQNANPFQRSVHLCDMRISEHYPYSKPSV